MKKILYIMNESWYWIKQRPHFIAEYLSKDYEVDVYCEKRYTKLVNNPVPDGMNVNEIFKFPFAHNPFFKKINSILQKDFLFRTKFNNTSGKYDLVWLSSNKHYQYLKQYIPKDFPIVYDCMDDILEFKGSKETKKVWQNHFDTEKELYLRSNVVFCSSNALKESLAERYGKKDKVFVINNAIHINTSSETTDGINNIPEDLSDLFNTPLKKICYIGSISEWFDFDTLISALKQNPGVMAVLIGPSDVTIPDADRLHYHPAVNHEIVIDIMKKADALIMPFQKTQLVMGVNPVKLYEYIYSEIPSISVAYPETEIFEDYVYLYRNQEEFINYIKLVQGDKLLFKQRKGQGVEYALQNTWEQRTKQISAYIKEVL